MDIASDAAGPTGGPIEAPKSFEEMSERTAFRAPIDPHLHKITDVLTEYSFNRLVPCGLSSCRTDHRYGFLVRTASGVETNIGNVCGRNHFGDDFVTAQSVHRRQVARRDALRTIATLRQQKVAIEARIATMVSGDFGVKWIRRVRKFLEGRLGVEGMRSLERRARSQEYRVEVATELTHDQITEEAARTGRKRDEVRYKTEMVGTLVPVPWLIYDFKGVLIDGLQAKLQVICDVNEATTETRVLTKLLKPLAGRENALEQSQEALNPGLAALSSQNLLLLLKAVKPSAPGKKAPELSGWDNTNEYRHLLKGSPLPL
ncbi:hypothetical protein [Polaromonas sp. YR568]|uniref:hypothetical protein n=1 Tax=Polaromonas sp. YR568 TaxID=1855301 RepID=UPI0031378D0B